MPQSVACSKCEEPSAHSIFVRSTDQPPPPPNEKDNRGVRVIRFCKTHWKELEAFLAG